MKKWYYDYDIMAMTILPYNRDNVIVVSWNERVREKSTGYILPGTHGQQLGEWRKFLFM
jgi:hypothetical protein